MNRRKKILLIWFLFNLLLGIAGFSTLFLFFQQLNPADQGNFIRIVFPYRFYFIVPSIVLYAGIMYATKFMVDSFWIPLAQLDEEVKLLIKSTPSNRIDPKGHKLIQSLIHSINEGAAKNETLLNRVNQLISQATISLEKENNVLAILIEELKEGVIVCNPEGSILLYNRKSKSLLSGANAPTSEKEFGYIGIGRSIVPLIGSPLLTLTFEDLKDRHIRGEQNLTQHFIIRLGSQLIDIEVIALVSAYFELNGFILVLQDMSRNLEHLKPFEKILSQLREQIRSPLANLRAAIESIVDYPDMDDEKRHLFLKIIQNQSVALSTVLDSASPSGFHELPLTFFLEKVSLRQWLESLQRIAKKEKPFTIELETGEQDFWVDMKRYFMIRAFLYIFGKLKDEQEAHAFLCKLDQKDSFVIIDLCWEGKGLSAELFQQWVAEPLQWETEEFPLSLSEILQNHDAEIWLQSEAPAPNHYIRLFLPKAKLPENGDNKENHVMLEGRPLFYDFNLFDKSVQHPELDDIPLRELSYTIFDTETTGLNPSQGDEIISIGAVRIVNGRLLENETYEQLVDPQRTIPKSSIEIHGIQPEQLVGKPVLEKVLPQFYQFVENTVIVGHNAAFDLKFLQLKEKATGIRFANSVLDTLLLSAVVHPYQDSHSLDAIAKRFDITVTGRHTALGDAMVTGQLLLKLIPILADQGILTLKQAIQASQKTYYARLHY